MKNDYTDITEQMGPALYYDLFGAPVYQIGVSDLDEWQPFLDTLHVIECQACRREFTVQMSHPVYLSNGNKESYGDPPVHGCVGDTMTPGEERPLTNEEKADFLILAVFIYERCGFELIGDYEDAIDAVLRQLCPPSDRKELARYINSWMADPIFDLTPPPEEFNADYIELRRIEQGQREIWAENRKRKLLAVAEEYGISVPEAERMETMRRSYEARKKEAISLLNHYFSTIFDELGKPWSSDNRAEMDGLADSLIDAAQNLFTVNRITGKD